VVLYNRASDRVDLRVSWKPSYDLHNYEMNQCLTFAGGMAVLNTGRVRIRNVPNQNDQKEWREF